MPRILRLWIGCGRCNLSLTKPAKIEGITPSEYISGDEKMVPYTGALDIKQYILGTPIRCGIGSSYSEKATASSWSLMSIKKRRVSLLTNRSSWD